jgi:hypothetical protein
MLVIISFSRTVLRQTIAAFLRNCLTALRTRKRGSLPRQGKTSTACATGRTSESPESLLKRERMELMTFLNMRQKLLHSRRRLLKKNRGRFTQPQVNRLVLMTLSIDQLEHDLLALVPEGFLERELDMRRQQEPPFDYVLKNPKSN